MVSQATGTSARARADVLLAERLCRGDWGGRVPGSKADLLQEEEQVREPACRRDVVQHVADAVGQHRPPSQGLGLRHCRVVLCIGHGHGELALARLGKSLVYSQECLRSATAVDFEATGSPELHRQE